MSDLENYERKMLQRDREIDKEREAEEIKEVEACDHLWQSGDVHSDFICGNCGERENLK